MGLHEKTTEPWYDSRVQGVAVGDRAELPRVNSEIGTGTPSEPRIRADRNESLLGPPRGVVPALLDFASSVDRYPPAELEVAARAAVATHYGVDPSEVLSSTASTTRSTCACCISGTRTP